MIRVLRINARRSAAPLTLLLLLVAGLICMFVSPGMWAEGWLYLGTAQRTYLILLWPLALALGAWQMRQEHRAQVDELLHTVARPRWQRLAVTAAVQALAVTVAYLVAFAAAAAWIADTATYLPGSVPAMVANGVLSLVAAVWIGMGVGYLLPFLVTAPALAVVGFGVQISLSVVFRGSEWLGNLLSPYMSRPWDPYYTLPAGFNGGQAIWLAGLAVAGLVLVAAATRRSRLTAIAPLVLGVGLAVAIAPRQDTDSTPWVRDLVGAQMVCADGTPRVCVTKVRTAQLPKMTPLAREALAKVAELPGAPTSAMEDWTLSYGDGRDAPGVSPDPNSLEFLVEAGGEIRPRAGEDFVPRTLRDFLARSCPDTTQKQYDEDQAAAEAGGYWLAGRPTDPAQVLSEPNRVRQLWDGLQALPRKQALQRIAAVRAAREQCGTSLTDILTGRSK
ncbi:hypothetical protein AB0M36_10325 [Actinoplanes sp. NPDC051346]|uniref:hypothetical protein n=1 Tax=Actinoplanes sp. NPDC051346 TaxID=3155048 RepID=UPI0034286C48